jgi:hypothetical protein
MQTGIQQYDKPNDGIQATVKTLQDGRTQYGYGPILEALKRNTDYLTTARYINMSGWRSGSVSSSPGGGYVVATALSVKGGGGYLGAIYKSYASNKVKQTGHSVWDGIPGGGYVKDVTGAVSNTYDAVTGGFGAISDFLGKLTDPHTWYRVAQILLGAIFLFLGAKMLVQGAAQSAAVSAAGDVAKGVAGKGVGKIGKRKGAVTSGAKELEPATT